MPQNDANADDKRKLPNSLRQHVQQSCCANDHDATIPFNECQWCQAIEKFALDLMDTVNAQHTMRRELPKMAEYTHPSHKNFDGLG